MRTLHTTREKIVKDLTRTRHMTAVSAVVLGTIFMPLLGMPDVYEVRAFQEAIDGFSAHAAQRDDEAARQRIAETVVPAERESEGWLREASARPLEVRRLSVSAPDEDMLVAMIAPDAPPEPLPAVAAPEVIEPVEQEASFIEEEEELEALPEEEVEEDFEDDPELDEKL